MFLKYISSLTFILTIAYEVISEESSSSVIEAVESTSFILNVTLVWRYLPQFNFKAIWRKTLLSSGVSVNCYSLVKQ